MQCDVKLMEILFSAPKKSGNTSVNNMFFMCSNAVKDNDFDLQLFFLSFTPQRLVISFAQRGKKSSAPSLHQYNKTYQSVDVILAVLIYFSLSRSADRHL